MSLSTCGSQVTYCSPFSHYSLYNFCILWSCLAHVLNLFLFHYIVNSTRSGWRGSQPQPSHANPMCHRETWFCINHELEQVTSPEKLHKESETAWTLSPLPVWSTWDLERRKQTAPLSCMCSFWITAHMMHMCWSLPISMNTRETSLLVQWLRLCAPNARGMGFDPWLENQDPICRTVRPKHKK